MILPPVALVNVTPGYTIACPSFNLVGRSVTSKASSLIIFYNSSVLAKNISIMNVHQYITENMTWFKKNIVDQQRKDLMDFINKTSDFVTFRPYPSTSIWSNIWSKIWSNIWSFRTLSFSWVLFGLCAGLVYYFFRCK